MPLKPFDLNQQIELPPELNTILVDSGLATTAKEDESKIKSARSIFNKEGATLEAAAQQVSNLMNNADTAGARLKAVELTMKVHGILQEMDDKPLPQINITVLGSNNKTLVNLVLPTI